MWSGVLLTFSESALILLPKYKYISNDVMTFGNWCQRLYQPQNALPKKQLQQLTSFTMIQTVHKKTFMVS